MAGPQQGLLQKEGPDSRGAYQLVANSADASQHGDCHPPLEKSPLRRKSFRSDLIGETLWQIWVKEKLEGSCCQAVTVIIIILNAICLGLETDMPTTFCWDVVETFFLIFFSFELVVRIFAFRAFFFDCGSNADFCWNMIDFIIVTVGVLAMVLVMLVPDTDVLSHNATLFRTVRLLRILRILRVVRVFRFLKQLYLLAYGFIEGANAVFWVATLACCANYVCAVLLVRLYRHEDNGFIQNRFSTIPMTMFTLFEMMSAPDVGKYREEIFDYPLLIFFIVVYIIFGSFGLNGLLTGVISESILEKNQARLESQRMERETKRRSLRKDAEYLFEQIDDEEGYSLRAEDILEWEPEVRSMFSNAGMAVPDYDIHRMLDVMDYDGNGTIEKSEFVNGILQICEDIRPVSFMEIHSEMSRCHSKISTCNDNIDRIMKSLESLTLLVCNRHPEVAPAINFTSNLSCAVAEVAPANNFASNLSHVSIGEGVQDSECLQTADGFNNADVVDSNVPVVISEPVHLAPTTKSGNLSADSSDIQNWPQDMRDVRLLRASKDKADELLRKVSEMQVPSAHSELFVGVLDTKASDGEMSVTARSQKKDAKSELATDPAATASLNKIGYIGSPGNLVDLKVKGTICTLLCGLASRGFQVYVGKPNEALRSVAPVEIKDMQTAGAAMFDAVIVLPGGPAARDEAQRFSSKTRLFIFVNSASEHGRPEWFNALSIEETFDLHDMQTDEVVEAIFKSLERPSPTSGNSTQVSDCPRPADACDDSNQSAHFVFEGRLQVENDTPKVSTSVPSDCYLGSEGDSDT